MQRSCKLPSATATSSLRACSWHRHQIEGGRERAVDGMPDPVDRDAMLMALEVEVEGDTRSAVVEAFAIHGDTHSTMGTPGQNEAR